MFLNCIGEAEPPLFAPDPLDVHHLLLPPLSKSCGHPWIPLSWTYLFFFLNTNILYFLKMEVSIKGVRLQIFGIMLPTFHCLSIIARGDIFSYMENKLPQSYKHARTFFYLLTLVWKFGGWGRHVVTTV